MLDHQGSICGMRRLLNIPSQLASCSRAAASSLARTLSDAADLHENIMLGRLAMPDVSSSCYFDKYGCRRR